MSKRGGVSGAKYVNMSSTALRTLLKNAPGPTSAIINAHLRAREERK